MIQRVGILMLIVAAVSCAGPRGNAADDERIPNLHEQPIVEEDGRRLTWAGEDDEGMFNKLKFWDRGKAAEYQVSLTGVGEKTEVVVLDKNGRWETDDQAGQLLNKLHDALNSGRI